MTPAAVVVAATLFLALFAAGCGGPNARSTSTTSAAAGSPAGSAAPATQARRQNACALVDREDIERIAGTKISMLHNIEDTDQTTCELSDDTTHLVLVYVKVFWKGGREMVRAEQAAMGMAKQIMNTPDVDIEALTGSGQVQGLADQAFYSDVMPSWVLKGDVLIQVIAPRWPHEKTAKTFNAVAKTALSRL
jgi:hypothetical protein